MVKIQLVGKAGGKKGQGRPRKDRSAMWRIGLGTLWSEYGG